MKIALCHSMQYAEKAEEVRCWFAARGYEVFPSSFNGEYFGLSDEEKERLKLKYKYNDDAISEHWKTINLCDRVLVLNYTKNGIENYLGGNSLIEMGFAYVLKKPIFLLNEVPYIPYYNTEIKAMVYQIIYGDLSKVLKDLV